MARSDADVQVAAAAMAQLTAASQALYMAHLTAVKAGQSTPPTQVKALQTAVLECAQKLVEICDVPDVELSDLMADLLSE